MIGDGYFTFHSMAFAKGHRQLGMSRYFRDASSTRIVIFDIVMFNILLSVACIVSTSRAATRIYRLDAIVSQPGVSMEAQIRACNQSEDPELPNKLEEKELLFE